MAIRESRHSVTLGVYLTVHLSLKSPQTMELELLSIFGSILYCYLYQNIKITIFCLYNVGMEKVQIPYERPGIA